MVNKYTSPPSPPSGQHFSCVARKIDGVEGEDSCTDCPWTLLVLIIIIVIRNRSDFWLLKLKNITSTAMKEIIENTIK